MEIFVGVVVSSS